MVAGTASEPTQIRQTYAYGAGGPSFELGIGLPVGELGEIGVRAGLRAGPIDDRLVCGAAGEGNVYCDDPDRPDQFTAPIVTVGALGRAPFFPRIFGQAGVGVTTVGPVPATTEPFQIDRSEGEDDEAGQVTLAAQPAAVFPFALIGIGFDAIYAEPWGLRGACGIQYALRRTLYEGPSSLNYPGGSLGGGGGPPVSATCTLGVRWSPGGGG